MTASRTGALVLINTCLAVLLVYNAWHGDQSAALLASQGTPFVPELPNLAFPSGAENFASIQDQPLFYSSRHSYVPPAPSAAVPIPPKPDYRLVGTFVIPAKPTVALLSNANGLARKVKAGDELDGWTVAAVDAYRVVLGYGQQSLEISRAGQPAGFGMQVVRTERTAQLTQTPTAIQSSDANPTTAAGVRVLGSGSSVVSASAPRPTFDTTTTRARLFRPPPK